MSLFGSPPNSNAPLPTTSSTPSAIYGRGDLQAAFNWLVNQPENIRKQASDPDRLMTLYYRSSGRPELARPDVNIETEAPISSQNFISDLRQINEAMRQFDRTPGYSAGTTAPLTPGPTMSASMASALSQSAAFAEARPQPKLGSPPQNQGASTLPPTSSVSAPSSMNAGTLPVLPGTAAIISEVREKLNLSSDAEAVNALVAIGYKSLKPLLG